MMLEVDVLQAQAEYMVSEYIHMRVQSKAK
jgi:hypothetical protein